MENMKNELEEAGALPRFWIRYVDDVLVIIKREEAGAILEKLYRAHRNINFTMVIEIEGEKPFLDLKIIWEKEEFGSRHLQETDPDTTNHNNHCYRHGLLHLECTDETGLK